VSDPLLIDRADGVATVTLNRPAALNSLTVAVKEALLAALTELRDDASVRAVVLTGAGRAFCAGQDLREHLDMLAAGDPAPLRTVEEHFNPITLTLAGMPKPVIAAVNGVAAGAGAALSFAADFRIAAAGARFVLSFANVGLGADSGVSWTLPRLIGRARATSMMMLAEPVSAAEALTIGLVTEVVPDDQVVTAAQRLATRLAAGPTVAYAAIKETLNRAAGAPLADALAHEARWQARCGTTEDHRAATAAFLGKTQPVFHGR
jgi:2-(1,2-epoxy-1,2-dihydrophenyl)acetyl-CoA isomerase